MVRMVAYIKVAYLCPSSKYDTRLHQRLVHWVKTSDQECEFLDHTPHKYELQNFHTLHVHLFFENLTQIIVQYVTYYYTTCMDVT